MFKKVDAISSDKFRKSFSELDKDKIWEIKKYNDTIGVYIPFTQKLEETDIDIKSIYLMIEAVIEFIQQNKSAIKLFNELNLEKILTYALSQNIGGIGLNMKEFWNIINSTKTSKNFDIFYMIFILKAISKVFSESSNLLNQTIGLSKYETNLENMKKVTSLDDVSNDLLISVANSEKLLIELLEVAIKLFKYDNPNDELIKKSLELYLMEIELKSFNQNLKDLKPILDSIIERCNLSEKEKKDNE